MSNELKVMRTSDGEIPHFYTLPFGDKKASIISPLEFTDMLMILNLYDLKCNILGLNVEPAKDIELAVINNDGEKVTKSLHEVTMFLPCGILPLTVGYIDASDQDIQLAFLEDANARLKHAGVLVDEAPEFEYKLSDLVGYGIKERYGTDEVMLISLDGRLAREDEVQVSIVDSGNLKTDIEFYDFNELPTVMLKTLTKDAMHVVGQDVKEKLLTKVWNNTSSKLNEWMEDSSVDQSS